MHISINGAHSTEDAMTQLNGVLDVLRQQYNVHCLRDIHLNIVLVDAHGYDVELINDVTNKAYNRIDIEPQPPENKDNTPHLRLVVNNVT